MRDLENLHALRKENQELRHRVQALCDELQRATARLEMAQRSSQEAWAFARLAFKGRGVTPVLPHG
jgi:predicted RNase H-like nuclease (RuvC/YqgF family)